MHSQDSWVPTVEALGVVVRAAAAMALAAMAMVVAAMEVTAHSSA